MEFIKLILFTFFITSTLNAQVNTDSSFQNFIPENNPISQSNNEIITFEASYTGDAVANLSGGIRRGATYIGMGNLTGALNTGNAGLWRGGELFINGAFTHGESPSTELIGDFQVASNISASNRIYLHELWYKQEIKSFDFIIGLQDLNAEFVASETGLNFMNSSFGIPSVISSNVPAPIFPLTALGFTAIWHVTDDINLQAAVYDGKPTEEEFNFYNTNWDLSQNDGALLIAESQFKLNLTDMPFTFKAGYYYHTGLREDMGDVYGYRSIFSHNHGAYIITDHKLWTNLQGNREINAFMQLSFSPEDINNHNYYLGGGVVLAGVFKEADKDALGLAFAHAGFNRSYLSNETALELFYKYQLFDYLFFQPDLQYIINPAGGELKRDNALVLFFKTGINF